MKGFSQTMITKGGFESLEEERNSCGLNISLTSEPEMSLNKNSIKLRKGI